ncbi:MAG: DNA-3-methyladenine glycosylase 2 family protein [Firmicutes bacterium]|nr:DNA-3-methyladenine glycosylase 2 family protein [Bacillota bacterium]
MSKPDWTEAMQHLRNADPVLAGLIDKYDLCTLAPDRDLFGSLCESIICQQISTKAGESIARRFRALFPDARPTPEELALLDETNLRSAGLSPQKMGYLKDLARKCLDGTINLPLLDRLPEDEITRELLAVKGVGPWTVTMFLIFALNRTDVLPVGDLGLRRAVQLAYGLENLPDKPRLEEIAKPWHPYETIATWYLWRSLENKKEPDRGRTKEP